MTAYRLRDVTRSEWTKFISLRSSRWTLLTFPVTSVVLAMVIGWASGAHYQAHPSASGPPWDPTNNVLAGLVPGYLIIPLLGVLTMTSEYRSGAIRSTLTAVPRRGYVFAAKALMLATVAFAVCEFVTFVAFFASQPLLGDAPRATIGQPGVLRALVLSGTFLALMGLFGLGLGAAIRSSGGAITAYVAAVILVPDLLLAVPGNLWRFGAFTILANSVTAAKVQPEFLSAWTGLAAMAVYAALACGVGLAVLCRRDA